MNSIKLYRVSRFLYKKKVPFLPKIIKGLIFLVYNSIIPYTCEIGKGSKLAYGGISVVLHSECTIGENVIIGQGVTIGRKLKPNEYPVIGNNVYIATGSKILGDVKVGNNVIIGANSVVTKDVPDNCIVAGAPAKKIRNLDQNLYELMGKL